MPRACPGPLAVTEQSGRSSGRFSPRAADRGVTFGAEGETAAVIGSKLLTRPDIAQRVELIRKKRLANAES